MNIERILHGKIGKIFMSVLLGLGLATLFRKVCKNRDCIVFYAPDIEKKKGKFSPFLWISVFPPPPYPHRPKLIIFTLRNFLSTFADPPPPRPTFIDVNNIFVNFFFCVIRGIKVLF